MYDDEDMWSIDAAMMQKIDNTRTLTGGQYSRPTTTATQYSKPTTTVQQVSPTAQSGISPTPTVKPTEPVVPGGVVKPIKIEPIQTKPKNKINIQVYSILPMFIKKGISFRYTIYDHDFNKKIYEGETKNGFVFDVIKGHKITIRVIPKGQYIGDVEKTITVNKDTVITFQFVPSPIQALLR